MEKVRQYDTGATRSSKEGKPEYEGYLSPLVIRRYGDYMLKHQFQADGQKRSADNWQKGMPQADYIDSAWRHFLDWWLHHRGYSGQTTEDLSESLCALIFNASGYLHELLKEQYQNESVAPPTTGGWAKQSSPSGVPYWFPKKPPSPPDSSLVEDAWDRSVR